MCNGIDQYWYFGYKFVFIFRNHVGLIVKHVFSWGLEIIPLIDDKTKSKKKLYLLPYQRLKSQAKVKNDKTIN